ncbi:sensor histidine kinase [Naumannella halotolerans]|uniref:histidine kinase n=1 Tax=Naumannella halotolerans TaxID=993414 RepID=A0A4R7J3Y0_9ACTN|nr:HAMP domain-containing sensor histidine kinase [Naumannella halotolerans]TDT31246.1 two-component system sensor histidine kinase MprB [Naumannella halotolerans]
MHLLRRIFGGPTLPRRITWLTTIVVAAGVWIAGLTAFFVTRLVLYDQLDGELTQVASTTSETISSDLSTMGGLNADALNAVNVTLVVVSSDRSPTYVEGAQRTLQVGADELAVARLQEGSSARTGQATDGTPYRIVAVPMTSNGNSYALVIGRALQPTTEVLRVLLIVVILVGALLAAAAAIVGGLVARSSLQPLRDLSAAVTRVTRTDSLDPIEVTGDDELSQLTRSFNAMLFSLASSRARQRRLIADAGHELRTPLTSLRTNIELLAADQKSQMLPPEAREEILGDIAAQLAEFTTLIQDLVQLAREDRMEPTREQIDLRDVVSSALQRVRRRGPGLHFDVELNPLYLMGEPDNLERAVTNLLDNAVKFSPPGGTIRVYLEGDQLRISDEGPGIAEEDLPHVFDRFYRADAARNTPGTGLGLSIVAQTVARHGGWVRAAASAQGGAEFTLRLPGSTTPTEDSTRSETAPPK